MMRQLSFGSDFSLSSSQHNQLSAQTAANQTVLFKTSNHSSLENSPADIIDQDRSQGSLTELRVGQINPMNPGLLIPLLASVANEQRWLMWLSKQTTSKGQWSQHLVESDLPIMHMTTNNESQWLLALRAVSSGNHHVCVEWQGPILKEQRERLRSAAEKAGTHLFIITQQH